MSHPFPSPDPAVVAARRAEQKRRRREKVEICYDPTEVLSHRSWWQTKPGILTPLAGKYSHPIGLLRGFRGKLDNKILDGTGSSGLTPVDSPRRYLPYVGGFWREHRTKRRRLRAYQRKRFWNFTAGELEDLEALAPLDRNRYPKTLDNPLFALFRRDNWLDQEKLPAHQASVPLYGGHDGFWEANHPLVWSVLEPCCQLATKILSSMAAMPWLDTLLFGEIKSFGADSIYGAMNWIKPRPLEVFNQADRRLKIWNRMEELLEGFNMCISSGYTDLDSQLPVTGLSDHVRVSITDHIDSRSTGRLHVSVEVLQPLLREDLTAAERCQCTHRVAAALIHELMHALWDLMERELPGHAEHGQTRLEPYMDQEILPELGYSMETRLWGGELSDFVEPQFARGGGGLGTAGYFLSNYFTDRHGTGLPLGTPDTHRADIPRAENPYFQYDNWPVPASWSAWQFDVAFWHVVDAFGGTISQFQKPTLGTRFLTDIKNPSPSDFTSLTTLREDEDLSKAFEPADVPHTATNDQKNQILLANTKEAQRWRILQKYYSRTAVPDPPIYMIGHHDSDDSDDGSDTNEEEIPEPSYSCARWGEISHFMFNNRGPLQLGLDSMTVVSEPSFLRYILNYGGINISAHVLRDFLGVCMQRRELFYYDAFPSPGMVYRVETGWPEWTPWYRYKLPRPAARLPSAWLDLESDLKNVRLRSMVYVAVGESLEMDYGGFWDCLNAISPPRFPRERMRDVLIELTVRRRDRFVKLGPEGIVRLVPLEGELELLREDYASDFTKKRMEEFEEMEAEAADMASDEA